MDFISVRFALFYTTAYKEEKAKSRTLKLADVNVKIDVTFGVTSILRNVLVLHVRGF